MPLFHLILLALIQGITEFLPISSSGHLLLFHNIVTPPASTSAEEMNLLMDIGVHVGTLIAVLTYFWRDVLQMVRGIFPFLCCRFDDAGARLNVNILIGSIPVIIAGFILHAFDPLWLRQTWIVATTTIVFGALLWWADECSAAQQGKSADRMSIKDAFMIGVSQILALIPGTSRSGITMTASRMLGYSRTESARYSLLLSIVAISGAGLLGALDVADINSAQVWTMLGIAAALSCVSALVAIAVMMRWLEKQSFRVFAIYRFILGGALFAALALGWIA